MGVLLAISLEMSLGVNKKIRQKERGYSIEDTLRDVAKQGINVVDSAAIDAVGEKRMFVQRFKPYGTHGISCSGAATETKFTHLKSSHYRVCVE